MDPAGQRARPGTRPRRVAAANTQPSDGRPLHGGARERPRRGQCGVEQARRPHGRAEVPVEEETPTSPVVERITWFQVDGVHFELGTLADGLSVMMLFTVTLISLLVHIYSTEYLHGDRRFTHYYAFLSLFTAAMLFYVISSNTLQMLTGWELVGVCSFVLIGHWWEEKRNTDAALKAFLTNRVGDVGLMIGVILTFFAAGASSFDVLHINQAALSGGVSGTLLLIGALCLFGGVTSKSGQFPLHTWLPDAMAGPTPVSALIHAATMVVAGVYLIARLYPVFYNGLHIGTGDINYVAFIGAFTTVFGASLAFVQYDIKRVLAYSTISQLGLHGHGPGRRRLDRWRVPPLHPRLLQGLPLPLRRLGEPRRPPHLRHAGDGRPAQVPCARRSPASPSPCSPSSPSRPSPASGRRTRSWPAPPRASTAAAYWLMLVVRPDDRVHDRGLHDPVLVDDLLRRVPRPRHAPRVARRS